MGGPRTIQPDNAAARLRDSLRLDFSGAYMAVSQQLLKAERRPASLDDDNVLALTELLTDPQRFATARQRFFLLRQAARTLATVYGAKEAPRTAAGLARQGLRRALRTTRGPALQAAAGALGHLPVAIPQPKGPALSSPPPEKLPILDCHELLDRARIKVPAAPYFMGRTLILPSRDSADLVAVKLARTIDDAPNLAKEVFWLQQLSDCGVPDLEISPQEKVHVPIPLAANGTPLFRLRNLPVQPNSKGTGKGESLSGLPDKGAAKLRHAKGLVAIAFKTCAAYFTYPNDSRPECRPTPAAITAIMARNARQMGVLASQGILHTAPIPLFHNRVQRHRRDDGGRYQWYRGGRLDRWLTSCAFPNMGETGLRDFEHLEIHCGSSERLFREIGSHFLSLLLVTGAYFRSAAPRRVGQEADGRPVDVRDLFDPHLLERLVKVSFSSYYQGFTGQLAAPDPGIDMVHLCRRMVTEMGRDRYMIEMLRAVDQKEMAEETFVQFLREGGMPEASIARQKRGEADIELMSGPHLGNFNRQTSLPELTDAVAVMAALCMEGRHALDRELWR
jgi:hypothetical protein